MTEGGREMTIIHSNLVPMNILFVCTANIVRSFMAERILAEKLKEDKKTGIDVSSAAVTDMHDMPADRTAVEILHEQGLDGAGHHSRLLTEDMVSQADMIIVMEGIHKRIILVEYPEAEGKIHLLKSFSPDYNEEHADIKDPYKLSMFQYRLCFSEIYLAIDGLMKCI
jgi:protein-tyrosine phosphatase